MAQWEMRYKLRESFASRVEEKKTGLVLLVLAGAFLGKNLDGVVCYTDGMLKEDRLCIGLALSVQPSETRAGNVNLQEARGKKVFRQQSGLFVVVFLFTK